MGNETPNTPRPRAHPEERFAPSRVPLDLTHEAASLRAETDDGQVRHRQKALYKDGGLTIALFVFPPGTGLPVHRAAGTVSMHVLHGRLNVTAGDEHHDLSAGQMLLLAPGVPHALTAESESELLVTVSLQPGGTPSA